MNILIVDDEELMIRALCRHLKFESYKVFTANDTSRAKQMLSEESIDVLLTDMDLGEGSQHGRSLLEWTSTHSPTTKRILMSGLVYHAQQAPEAHHVLQKPFPITALKTFINSTSDIAA